jgi:ferredoxin/flavodoxin---NADP+ reductase
VLGPDGPLPGEYAVGWVKRGATGVIGSNKSDAAETARSVLADIEAGALPRERPTECWQPPAEAVDYAGWQRIDAGERALGEASGRAREKVADWDTLRALARG